LFIIFKISLFYFLFLNTYKFHFRYLHMKELSKKYILAVIGISLILIGIIILNYRGSENAGTTNFELRKFKSMDELVLFLKTNTKDIPVFWIQAPRGELLRLPLATVPPPVTPLDTASDQKYSKTNVQVEGVDEGDIVKTDGNYIYTISNNSVVIVESYPPEKAKVLSKINLGNLSDFWSYWYNYYWYNDMYELYVYKNKLIVIFKSRTDFIYGMPVTFTMIPNNYTYYQPSTKVYVYDIEDRSNPKLEWKLTVEGRYLGSRMIDNELYLITLYDIIEPIKLPTIYSNNETNQIKAEDIYYSPIFDNYFQISLVLKINIVEKSYMYEAFLLGSSNVLYVSLNNIYITQVYYLKRETTYFYTSTPIISTLGFHNVFTTPPPTTPPSTLPPQTTSPFITSSIPIFIYEAITIIHRINITDNLKYEAIGKVNGWLLNQFSMDEYKGYFRIATTSEHFDESSGRLITSNNVYILNMNLETIGKIEGIALNERIYAARFMGDKLYMVTFRQIDPFFVIDLSNPYEPEILGYLKIPGFSTYLHPYKEYIIGIGLIDNKLKISLFDVRDFKNPKEISNLTIGYDVTNSTYSYTTSEALYDHKAFLLDEERGLLVIPVYKFWIEFTNYTQIIDNTVYEYYYKYKYMMSQYALVIKINEGKLEIIGKVTHLNNFIVEENFENYKYFIKRSLYIEDFLYTISNSKIKINEINTLEEVKEINL